MPTIPNNNPDNLPVYRVVNGKLERIPGDVPDPNRRYSQVSAPEGNFLKEFTEEEEQQRNLEENQWEEEAPKRKEAEMKRFGEAKQFRESLKYEKRFIAFVDILGWRQAVGKSSGNGELIHQMGITLNTVRGTATVLEWQRLNFDNQKVLSDIQLSQFSDCIVLSTKADRDGYFNLIWYLRGIVFDLLRMGFFLRGGITVGELIHREFMIYGPGLIRAYDLERKCAVNPRIILDDNLPKDLFNNEPANIGGRIVDLRKYWKVDKDGVTFYDFLQPYFHFPGEPIDPIREKFILKPIYDLVIKRLKEFEHDTKIFPKYQWLAQYCNNILLEYPNIALDPIKWEKPT